MMLYGREVDTNAWSNQIKISSWILNHWRLSVCRYISKRKCINKSTSSQNSQSHFWVEFSHLIYDKTYFVCILDLKKTHFLHTSVQNPLFQLISEHQIMFFPPWQDHLLQDTLDTFSVLKQNFNIPLTSTECC